jgi:hypothetical protein
MDFNFLSIWRILTYGRRSVIMTSEQRALYARVQ